MRETIEHIIAAFSGQGSNISSESKKALRAANDLLQKLLDANLGEDELKKQADIIITGAIITVLIMNDDKYDLQGQFGNKYLYPLSFGQILDPSESHDFNSLIPKIGERALIAKDIPFTGTIDYRVFPLLKEVGIGPDHFANYKLITDPNSIDTTQRSQYRKDHLLISNKIYRITTILEDLGKKIDGTNQHYATNAPSVVKNLLAELTTAKTLYKTNLEAQLAKSHEDFQSNVGSIGQDFIKDCATAIDKAKSQLENDLDWGSYLQNLLITLVNVVISGFNKVTGKGVSFFETNVPDSVKEIEASENKLSKAQP